jgi:hypothetical protein
MTWGARGCVGLGFGVVGPWVGGSVDRGGSGECLGRFDRVGFGTSRRRRPSICAFGAFDRSIDRSINKPTGVDRPTVPPDASIDPRPPPPKKTNRTHSTPPKSGLPPATHQQLRWADTLARAAGAGGGETFLLLLLLLLLVQQIHQQQQVCGPWAGMASTSPNTSVDRSIG